ncbi:MAG TPA: hypothetical protein GX708_24745 [Gallicola sp.]|nr:hypothetical protein [Gallicola sp.]
MIETTNIENNLKSKLCNELIEKGLVKENDVIKHSYTSNKLNDDRLVPNHNISPTLDTRCDCLGVCVGTYQYAKSDNFMQGKDRLQLGKEVSDTLQTTPKEGIVYSNLRIRKLTPKECFRLMGVKDEDYEKLTCSNAQKYKQAGNSIVVNVLMAIFKELIK